MKLFLFNDLLTVTKPKKKGKFKVKLFFDLNKLILIDKPDSESNKNVLEFEYPDENDPKILKNSLSICASTLALKLEWKKEIRGSQAQLANSLETLDQTRKDKRKSCTDQILLELLKSDNTGSQGHRRYISLDQIPTHEAGVTRSESSAGSSSPRVQSGGSPNGSPRSLTISPRSILCHSPRLREMISLSSSPPEVPVLTIESPRGSGSSSLLKLGNQQRELIHIQSEKREIGKRASFSMTPEEASLNLSQLGRGERSRNGSLDLGTVAMSVNGESEISTHKKVSKKSPGRKREDSNYTSMTVPAPNVSEKSPRKRMELRPLKPIPSWLSPTRLENERDLSSKSDETLFGSSS